MDIRRLSCSVTIASSAALLFVIQPIAAKTMLPRFGGSAGVWVTSMMFFQAVLLLGYLYSFWISRYPGPRVRTIIHLAVIALTLAVLPLRFSATWNSASPTFSVLAALAFSVGLPFFLLSTTNSLLQSWYAGRDGAPLPYRLFALSNTACLLALVAYPLVIEPASAVSSQLGWWSIAYLAVALLIAAAAISNRGWTPKDKSVTRTLSETREAAPAYRPFLWIALAACASALWLSMANYLSQEVAAIPLLWVLPLALYLFTFVLCFEWEGWYRPAIFRWLLPMAWIAIGSRIGLARGTEDLRIDIPVILAALFILCSFCHGELARTKPAARQGLAFFYLMAATGGALGGIFVGLVAPAIFSTYLELPIGVVSSVFLALVLVYGVTSRGRLIRLGALAIAALVAASSFHGGSTSVAVSRNFYGPLQVRDSGEGEFAVRALYNGRTVHGLQFLAPSRRQVPTGYYGIQSGAGRLLDAADIPNRRVGIVGLGAGTLAVYGRKGDFFRFYEINPAVVQAASHYFRFLADSAAVTDVVVGDGRLRLEQEQPQSFDLIVLDAFSDDAIPVHLLTREAFQIYFARLRTGGSLAIHLTNRYLDLNPVVESLAAEFQKIVVRVHSAGDPEQQTLAADWAVVTGSKEIAAKISPYAETAGSKHGPLWTDEYSNLLQVWR